MYPEDERAYLQLAMDNPNLLCSEVPAGLLQAASYAGDEPDEFLRTLLAAGHTQWLLQRHGPQTRPLPEQVDRAVLVLWVRACSLYTSRMTGRSDEDWDKPFFSDEGLYH